MTEQNPYQTPATDIGNGDTQRIENELASPWIRLVATIVDTIIMMIFIIPIQIAMGIFDGFPEHMVEPDFFTTITVLIASLLVYTIINGYTLHRNGQTLGKLIFKIKIVRTDFSKVTLSRIIFIRNVPMSLITQIPYVGMVIGVFVDPLLIFRKSRKCLHDNIADTVVIKA